jgi:hypothetical protein
VIDGSQARLAAAYLKLKDDATKVISPIEVCGNA